MLSGPGGNVVVLRGPDGKIVVDTFVQPAWTELKRRWSSSATSAVATVIDTHWHFDHADNNDAFRKAGAASSRTRILPSACRRRTWSWAWR